MRTPCPRLRMFAGPNGSGKSTIKSVVPPKYLGFYINADDLEKEARQRGFFDMAPFDLAIEAPEITQFFQTHPLILKSGLGLGVNEMTFRDERFYFNRIVPNSYFAAVAADFIRHKLLDKGESFSFETVMSSPDKVEFLKKAQARGYRTYLYYVATIDAQINVLRVQNRVQSGGHDVPENKIKERYDRSLDLLWDAIEHTDRAYIFDNSETKPNPQAVWLAEITSGKELEPQVEVLPAWFKKAILDKASIAND